MKAVVHAQDREKAGPGFGRWRLGGLLLFVAAGLVAQPRRPVEVVSGILRGTGASAVALEWTTGAVIASVGAEVGRRATPGSAIKPLLLEYALEHEILRPQTQVYCRRSLRIGTRQLPCTHPDDDPVFTAERALAESCNTWFAELGKRFPNEELDKALNAAGVRHVPMGSATVEQRELAALGLQGVKVSPAEMVDAYRRLLLQLPAGGTVARGLRGSVEYGMAHPAYVRGMTIIGKTGTASDPGQVWTHGWFAGGVPGKVVLVIFVPHGDGGVAAALAQRCFRAMAAAGVW